MANKPKKISMKWSHDLAYVIGIITADGNLSPSGRHINITSKDEEMVQNCKAILEIDNKIGRKARGYSQEKKYFVLQFGSIAFYKFLLEIGLTPNKSKTIEKVDIPDKYFSDFLRGVLDGDGNINVTSHPQSNHLQLRLRFTSGSKVFLEWLHKKLTMLYSLNGGWYHKHPQKDVYTLAYGKSDSIQLLNLMYNNYTQYCLSRKYKVAKQFLQMPKW